MQWVRRNKIAEMTGMSLKAVDCKRQDGVWLMDIHWRKAPDGTIWYNTEAIDAWVEGIEIPEGQE